MLKFNIRKNMRISNKLLDYYYLIIFLVYFLDVFFPKIIRPGVIAALIIIVISTSAIPKKIDMFDMLILVYIFYNMFAILLTMNNGFPMTVGIAEFSSSSLPILFYFFGKKFYLNRDKFYINFILACLFCYIVGLYWFLTVPDYYISYLGRDNINFYLFDYFKDPRLGSFVGSTAIGIYAPISALLAYYFHQRTHQKKYLIMYYLSIIISLLSQQRASYLMILVVIILVNYKYFNKKITKKRIAGEITVLLFLLPLVLLGYLNEFQNIFVAINRFSTVFSDRSMQWLRVTELGYNIFLGNGLGSMSHRAIQYSKLLINDGAYFKLLAELGIVGFVLFTSIVISTLIRIYNKKRIKDYFVETTIVILFLIQSIGSNTIFFQESAPLFWIAIGFIFSREK